MSWDTRISPSLAFVSIFTPITVIIISARTTIHIGFTGACMSSHIAASVLILAGIIAHTPETSSVNIAVTASRIDIARAR